MNKEISNHHLNEMKLGWFVGNFAPTLYKTDQVEVAVKKYKKGDYEKRHYHVEATEITVIVIGKVKMNGEIKKEGDIVVIPPTLDTDFEVLEDTITTVVKIPGTSNDKYMGIYED